MPLISQYFKTFPTSSSCSARKNVEEDRQGQEDEEERNSDENNNNDIRDFDAGENGQEQQEPDKDMELEVLHVEDDDHPNNQQQQPQTGAEADHDLEELEPEKQPEEQPAAAAAAAAGPSVSEDPALWGDITEELREALIMRGASAFHNRAEKYPASLRWDESTKKNRSLTKDLLTKPLHNGETVPREWIMYSPSTGEIYCFPCKVLSTNCASAITTTGYSDWKHPERIREHEDSEAHKTCVLSLIRRTHHLGTVDASLGRQIEAEGRYWKEVLRRVVAVIKFLCVRGLAFRGEDELLHSEHNGNYLGILELIAEFDPFLSEHLEKYGQRGRGSTSYLSSTICEEVIGLMGDKTKREIAEEIQQAKYFSVIIDSTPDLSHVDQLTFVFRFVKILDGKAAVLERFIGFEPIHSHTGSSLADCVRMMVRDLGLDLSNCRGQSYDNASNMSGKYNGCQAHLKKDNPLIHYIPCAAHSLNLVGVNCVENSCQEATDFFDTLQSTYACCASSTHRWNTVFGDNTDITLSLKSLSNTRWSARADSTRALHDNYARIMEALQGIASDSEERQDTRNEAAALCAKLARLETALLAIFWDRVLQRFKMTSKELQKRDMDLRTAVGLLESLRTFVSSLRGEFGKYETSAKAITGVTNTYQDETRRTRKRKAFADENVDNEVVLRGSQKFQVETFYVLIDRLLAGLNTRMDAYKEVNDCFGVLFDTTCDDADLRKRAESLSSAYQADLNRDFPDELVQFRAFASTEQDKTPANMLQFILRQKILSTFPNVYVALRLFLTLPVSNCEGERSFSKLKRIKNELRTTMTQKRLSALSLMAVESELVRDMAFEDIIQEFSKKKSRKKNF